MSYYSLRPTHAVMMYLPLLYVCYRDELEWILRDILWQRCKHKPDIAFETIARYQYYLSQQYDHDKYNTNTACRY